MGQISLMIGPMDSIGYKDGYKKEIKDSTRSSSFSDTLAGYKVKNEGSDKVTYKEQNNKEQVDEPISEKTKEIVASDSMEKTEENPQIARDEDKDLVPMTESKPKEKEESPLTHELIQIMSQSLQLSTEEVKSFLEELGLELSDLLEEEGFAHFMSTVLGKKNTAELLMKEAECKGLHQLFEEIKQLEQQKSSLEDPQLLWKDRDRVNLGQLESIPLDTAQQGEADLHLKEPLILPFQEDDKLQGEESLTEKVSFMAGEEPQKIGITVPIHGFSSTINMAFHQQGQGERVSVFGSHSIEDSFILEQFDFKVLGQAKELNIQLSPKELGTVHIKIIENHGLLVAEIKVDNEKTKAFMENDLIVLKEKLQEQGINIGEVRVDIRQNNRQSHMEQEKQKASKRIQEIIDQQWEKEEEENNLITQFKEDNDSGVDYMI